METRRDNRGCVRWDAPATASNTETPRTKGTVEAHLQRGFLTQVCGFLGFAAGPLNPPVTWKGFAFICIFYEERVIIVF